MIVGISCDDQAANNSTDADQDPLSFSWDLGDGTAAGEPLVAHVYDEGVYDVRLTVEDEYPVLDGEPPYREAATA